MTCLVIALGNEWRRDDGVAHRVLELLPALDGVERRAGLQLTPEMAAEIAPFDMVVFVDADLGRGEPGLEPVDEAPAPGCPITHEVSPREVVATARRLFGFRGPAWVLHVPGEDFAVGEGLSATAEANAHKAAGILLQKLDHQR